MVCDTEALLFGCQKKNIRSSNGVNSILGLNTSGLRRHPPHPLTVPVYVAHDPCASSCEYYTLRLRAVLGSGRSSPFLPRRRGAWLPALQCQQGAVCRGTVAAGEGHHSPPRAPSTARVRRRMEPAAVEVARAHVMCRAPRRGRGRGRRRGVASDLRPASLGSDSATSLRLWPSARTHLARTPRRRRACMPHTCGRAPVAARVRHAPATPARHLLVHRPGAAARLADQGGLRGGLSLPVGKPPGLCTARRSRGRRRRHGPSVSTGTCTGMAFLRTRRGGEEASTSSIRKCRGQPVGTALDFVSRDGRISCSEVRTPE